jgi:hypothetical protein
MNGMSIQIVEPYALEARGGGSTGHRTAAVPVRLREAAPFPVS